MPETSGRRSVANDQCIVVVVDVDGGVVEGGGASGVAELPDGD